MIGLEFLRHGTRFAARARRRYFSAECSDSRKYVCVRRLIQTLLATKLRSRSCPNVIIHCYITIITVCNSHAKETRSLRGAECWSDHRLVRSITSLRFKPKCQRQRCKKGQYRWSKSPCQKGQTSNSPNRGTGQCPTKHH